MTPISSDREAFRSPRISPTGKQIAVAVNDETRRSDIWIYDAERGSKHRLTTARHNLAPVWSMDGQHVTFSAYPAGLLEARADGSGAPQVLLADDRTRYPSSWTPDGRDCLFHSDSPEGLSLGVLQRGVAPHPLTVSSASSASHGQVSPDGRWLAYFSDESGVDQVYVVRFPGMTEKVVISTETGSVPRWSRDGQEIFTVKATP